MAPVSTLDYSAAIAYAHARGLDLTLDELAARIQGEQLDYHKLVDLENGLYVSPDDAYHGYVALIAQHGGVVTVRELLEDEFGALDRPPQMYDGDEVICGDPDIREEEFDDEGDDR